MPKLKAPKKSAASKAAKKLEKLRQQELLVKKNRRDKLSKEVEFGKQYVKECEQKWKNLLLNIALPRMKADLEFAWHNFERVIDYKDFAISLLQDEIADAEEQHLMNFRNHSENIDILLTQYGDYLNEYKRNFENSLEEQNTQCIKETEEMKKKAEESEDYYKTMLFALDVREREKEKLVRGEYLTKFDEDAKKHVEILQTLRLGLERKYVDVWKGTEQFLNSYFEESMERRKHYNILSIQDESVQKLCTSQATKLVNMQRLMKTLKERFLKLQKTQGQKINDLMNERQYFADAFRILKARFISDKDLDSSNLILLTVQSNLIEEHLNKLIEKGSKILKLATLCRKLETESEKILPFPKITELDETEVQEDKHQLQYMHDLELFWSRLAQANTIRYSINEEKEYLKRENNILNRKIHKYCQCVVCPPSEMPLSETTEKNRKQSKVSVTDVSMMQKNYNKFDEVSTKIDVVYK